MNTGARWRKRRARDKAEEEMDREKKRAAVARILRMMAEEEMAAADFDEVAGYVRQELARMPVTKEFTNDTDWDKELWWVS